VNLFIKVIRRALIPLIENSEVSSEKNIQAPVETHGDASPAEPRNNDNGDASPCVSTVMLYFVELNR